MRITFLSWRDTGHPDAGGSEEYVDQLAGRLAARGHDVVLLCATHPGAVPDETVRGVHVRRRGGRLTVYLHGLLLVTLGARRRSDVVIEVVNGIPFGAGLLRRRGVVVLVHHLHREQWRMIYPGRSGRVGWWIERTTLRLYRGLPFVTVSRATAADLEAHGVPADRIHRVGNGAERRPPMPGPEPGAPVLCTLSRLVPHKRLEQAVDVVVALSRRRPDVRLRVIGSGWWEPELRRYVEQAGAAHLVELHGHVTPERRDELLASSTVMLLPSVREGWGLAVIEAALQGTPAVAYRTAGGVAESIRDDVTGLLVDTPDELCAATARIVDEPELRARLSAAARDRASSFDWDRSADQLERLVTTGLGQPPAGVP